MYMHQCCASAPPSRIIKSAARNQPCTCTTRRDARAGGAMVAVASSHPLSSAAHRATNTCATMSIVNVVSTRYVMSIKDKRTSNAMIGTRSVVAPHGLPRFSCAQGRIFSVASVRTLPVGKLLYTTRATRTTTTTTRRHARGRDTHHSHGCTWRLRHSTTHNRSTLSFLPNRRSSRSHTTPAGAVTCGHLSKGWDCIIGPPPARRAAQRTCRPAGIQSLNVNLVALSPPVRWCDGAWWGW